jgi:putative MATE family efflux protein
VNFFRRSGEHASAPSGRSGLRSRVLRLALPLVGSDLLQRGVGILDTLLVGRLGAAELGAVGLAQLLLMFVMALVQGLGVGGTVMVAFHTGATDERRRAWVARTILVIGLAATLGLGGGGILLSRVAARLMGADGRLFELTLAYLDVAWLLFGAFVFLHLVSAIFQGAGDTRTPFAAMVGVVILHILLALGLIFGLCGLPQLGVVGAALASGVSEAAGALWLLWRGAARGYFGRWGSGWNLEELWRVLRVGLPVAGERLITHGMQLVYARIVIHFGVAAYAAHQVGLSIESLSFLPGLGFAKATTALVGQRLGLGDEEGARASARQANRLSLAIMCVWGVSFLAFPRAWMALFTPDLAVLAYSVPLMVTAGILQPPLSVAMVMAGALRGAGETRVVLAAAILGGWCIRLPLSYGLGIAAGLGMAAVWASMILDWTVRAAILSRRFHRIRLEDVRL